MTDDIASSLGRPNAFGALVIDVTPSGPSDGVVLEGDIILEFDGKAIEEMRDLPRIVAETAVGKAVPVLVLRDGTEQTLDITLGRLEAGEALIADIEQNGDPVQPEPDVVDEPVGPAPGLDVLLGLRHRAARRGGARGVQPVGETSRAWW